MDCGCTSPPAFATYDPHTCSWKTSRRSARGASARSSPACPRSGMTRNGYACALPMPGPATAATASSSSPASPASVPGLRLLPTPAAGAFNDGEPVTSWLARRDRQKKPGRNGNGIGTPLPVAIALLPTPMASDGAPERSAQLGGQRPSGAKRQVGLPEVIAHRLAAPARDGSGPAAARQERLLPTPDTGISPNGHGRRGGRPGNGHQSGNSLDAVARTLAAGAAPAQPSSRAGGTATAWGSTSRRSAAGNGFSGTPSRHPPSRAPAGGPGCQRRSPSG